MIPLIAMGIPGSVTDVFLLAALVIHGLQPGPLLFTTNPDIVYVIFAACFFANIVLLVLIGGGGIRLLVKLAFVPLRYLFPVILLLCVLGPYADSNRVFDVGVTLGFAILGIVLNRTGFSLGAFIIGFVLGPITERSLRAGLTLSDGSYLDIFMHPVSATCVILAIFMFFWSLWSQQRANRRIEAALLKGGDV